MYIYIYIIYKVSTTKAPQTLRFRPLKPQGEGPSNPRIVGWPTLAKAALSQAGTPPTLQRSHLHVIQLACWAPLPSNPETERAADALPPATHGVTGGPP